MACDNQPGAGHRDDMMAAHCLPSQMMGIMPSNVDGLKNVEKTSRIFVHNEMMPQQKRLQELNYCLDKKVLTFDSYRLMLSKIRLLCFFSLHALPWLQQGAEVLCIAVPETSM